MYYLHIIVDCYWVYPVYDLVDLTKASSWQSCLYHQFAPPPPHHQAICLYQNQSACWEQFSKEGSNSASVGMDLLQNNRNLHCDPFFFFLSLAINSIWFAQWYILVFLILWDSLSEWQDFLHLNLDLLPNSYLLWALLKHGALYATKYIGSAVFPGVVCAVSKNKRGIKCTMVFS